jgi:rod shape-determining protein MreC
VENVISRFRNTLNLIVLMAVLLAQVIGLAVQVKKPTETGGTRLIRVWAIAIVTPITRGIIHTEDWFSNTWHDYVWLRGVRKENEDLKDQIAQMKMQEVRLVEDANQARRLQLLLSFKEEYVAQTLPAQVISTTGSEFSRAIYIDKGAKDGLKTDMPVIAPQGIVGKVLRAFSSTSLVLLINDPTSGAGVILESSRLQGILKGSVNGATVMQNVMTDEKVQPGERILTSGGDRIFPKGLTVGTVMSVTPGQDLFLNIRVKPAVQLSKLEEVLVITKMDERTPDALAESEPSKRAIDILAQRLPTVAPPAAATSDASKNPSTANANKAAPELSKPSAGAGAAGTGAPGAIAKKTTPAASATPGAVKPKPADQGTGAAPKKTAVETAKPVKAQTAVDPTKDAQSQ